MARWVTRVPGPSSSTEMPAAGMETTPFSAVTYEGVLQVTDAERFRAMLCQGMGRGKAYGLGLMTVMRGGN